MLEILTKEKMSSDERDVLMEGLYAHNLKSAYGAHTTIKEKFEIKLTDNDIFIGGAQCVQKANWILIETLWISENYRGQGYGKRLIESIKKEALQKNCNGIHLETYDFQGAESFYKENGFKEFARIEDYPTGFARIYFLMRL